jgi:hypothetical protein
MEAKMLNLRLSFAISSLIIIFWASYAEQSVRAQAPVSPELASPSAPSPFTPSASNIGQRVREPIRISYQNGELAIDTVNAPLGDILRAISIRTGALLRIPQEANEGVTRQIGPAPVTEVLNSLLNESPFNYIIEEFGANQSAPFRVTLLLKGSASRAMTEEYSDQGSAVAAALPQNIGEAFKKGVDERSALIQRIADINLQKIISKRKDEGASDVVRTW